MTEEQKLEQLTAEITSLGELAEEWLEDKAKTTSTADEGEVIAEAPVVESEKLDIETPAIISKPQAKPKSKPKPKPKPKTQSQAQPKPEPKPEPVKVEEIKSVPLYGAARIKSKLSGYNRK
jgi:outer membrane biosynthesis protein TonB